MGAVVWSKLIIYIVGARGLMVNFLNDLGWISDPRLIKVGLFGSDDTAFPTIVAIKILMGLVGNNAVLTGAFTRVPDEIYESAELDGAGFWRTYINIAVPCVWSTIATLMTFSLCSFITADYNVFLFTGGSGAHDTSTVGFLLYKITWTISNSAVSGDPYYGYPAALGVFLTCITLPVVLGGRKIIEKIFADVEV
jgi:ABC-type sugar transport system permease subunit